MQFAVHMQNSLTLESTHLNRAREDKGAKRHILTVSFEDWFHVGALRSVIDADRWDRFESRAEAGVDAALALLEQHDARATFFTLGWMAERFPGLVRKVADAGHEVASKGFAHVPITAHNRESFRTDLRRARHVIEQATGKRVVGHRVNDWITPRDAWVLEVLAEEEFAYDSSVRLFGQHSKRDASWARIREMQTKAGPIWEVPVTSVRFGRWFLPVGGGNPLRQLPLSLISAALTRHENDTDDPSVLWFQTWELDSEQPVVSGASYPSRLRHYRNLPSMSHRLSALFSTRRLTGIAEELSINIPETPRIVASEAAPFGPRRAPIAASDDPRERATVVIPCFNEAESIPYVARTLEALGSAMSDRFRLSLVLVDDGSRDGTWEALHAAFGERVDCRLVQHKENRGIAAAIATGIDAATDEIVCSIDADCSYDPSVLPAMIDQLVDDVVLVTASPYHPLGGVRNVEEWRLLLSRGLSWIYRHVLHTQLHTYTSCCRVYRRSAVVGLPLTYGDFRGILELLTVLDSRREHIVEHPAVLEARLFGQSKMRVVRTVAGHLRMLSRVVGRRGRPVGVAGRSSSNPDPLPATANASA